MTASASSVKQEFFLWFDDALSQEISQRVVAFHFNLYEGHHSVHVQLIGTNSFTPGVIPARDYKPGEEEFTTGENIFEIPFSIAGSDWQAWLTASRGFVDSYITSGNESSKLRGSSGVGIGFVDGDMHVLWQSSEA